MKTQCVIPLSHIREQVAGNTPQRLPEPPGARARAAVALILSGPADALNLCFIRRASNPLDHWSGQMALPGGRIEDTDTSTVQIAMRESHEEVGVLLHPEHHLGELSEMPISRHRSIKPGVLSAFVFYHGAEPAPFTIEPNEVAAAYWIPLKHLWDAANRTSVEYEQRVYTGIQYQGDIIWGLTLRVLESFAEVVGKPL